MAAKLEYDVSVKTENAKRKIKQDLSTVEGGSIGDGRSASGQGAAASGQAAAAADKAARSLNSLSTSADKAAPSIGRAVKAFAGIGISMAASYAANALPEGSMARKAIGYGGNILGGAVAGGSIGSAIPGVGTVAGAAIGGAAGAGKTYLENSGQEKSAKLDFFASELRHEKAMEWKRQLQNLTDLGDDPNSDIVLQRLRDVHDEMDKKKEAEAKLIEDIKKYIENGEYYSADFAKQSLAINRAQQEQLNDVEKGLDSKLKDLDADEAKADRTSPTDALARIGGNMSDGWNATIDSLAKNTDKTNSILGRIERKMQKGGTF